MRHPAATQRRPVRASLASLLTCWVAGCVTTYTPVDLVAEASQAPVAVPVSIPIASGQSSGNRLLLEFYTGILRRLQDAADDGDVVLLDSLVASYDKPDIPESVAKHLAGYRAIGRGIRFRQHVLSKAVLEVRAQPANGLGASPGDTSSRRAAGTQEVPALGAGLELQLRVPAMDTAVLLGSRTDRNPTSFSVSVTVADEYVDGSSRSLHTDGVVWLPETFELAGGKELLLPINIEAAASDAVRRNVTVRVDMRGHVQMDGLHAPIKSTAIGAGTYTQLPSGHEILAKQPLSGLKAALQDFQANNYASAYLAASMIPRGQRRKACALLMDQVRYGRADQARVAMAALQKVTGLSIAVGDRESWLSWWQSPALRERLDRSDTGR